MLNTDIVSHQSSPERERVLQLADMLLTSPIPKDQIGENLGLFLNSKELSRLLFMTHLYQLAVPVHGSVFEFGTRWGNNLAIFHACRSIFEPFNKRLRPIVGWDSFEGFPSIHAKDGSGPLMTPGLVATTKNYEQFLTQLLELHEAENPLSHLKRFELVKGDVNQTLPKYLKQHPETVLALAYFDMDLYAPTKKALQCLKPRMTKGTVLGFDEAADPGAPGVTLSIMETLGLNNVRLQRLPYCSRTSFCVIE